MKTLLPLFVVALAALASGCALFHAPYGADTAEDIRELMNRTNEVVADGDAGKLSLADSRRFLKQSQAQVQVMRLRYVGAEVKPHLYDLDREYAVLLRQHTPLRRRNTASLRTTLFALQSMTPVHSVFYRPMPPSTDDALDNTTPDTTSQRNCDKDHDHGGSNHNDRDCGCDHSHK